MSGYHYRSTMALFATLLLAITALLTSLPGASAALGGSLTSSTYTIPAGGDAADVTVTVSGAGASYSSGTSFYSFRLRQTNTNTVLAQQFYNPPRKDGPVAFPGFAYGDYSNVVLEEIYQPMADGPATVVGGPVPLSGFKVQCEGGGAPAKLDKDYRYPERSENHVCPGTAVKGYTLPARPITNPNFKISLASPNPAAIAPDSLHTLVDFTVSGALNPGQNEDGSMVAQVVLYFVNDHFPDIIQGAATFLDKDSSTVSFSLRHGKYSQVVAYEDYYNLNNGKDRFTAAINLPDFTVECTAGQTPTSVQDSGEINHQGFLCPPSSNVPAPTSGSSSPTPAPTTPSPTTPPPTTPPPATATPTTPTPTTPSPTTAAPTTPPSTTPAPTTPAPTTPPPTTPPPASGGTVSGLTVESVKNNEWQSEGTTYRQWTVTVRNTGSQKAAQILLKCANFHPDQSWNVVAAGEDTCQFPSWRPTLAPGEEHVFGFIQHNGEPEFALMSATVSNRRMRRKLLGFYIE